MTHKELSREIRKELNVANRNLTTAKRFGHMGAYQQGEAKLRHARDDIKSVRRISVSRRAALRHAIGFAGRRPHPKGCQCPFHGGHKDGDIRLKGIGKTFPTPRRATI